MDYTDYTAAVLKNKLFYVEDLLKAQAFTAKAMEQRNTADMYEQFRKTYLTHSKRPDCPIYYSGKKSPQIIRAREYAEIVGCLRKVNGFEYLSMSDCMTRLPNLTEEEQIELEKVVMINIGNLKKLRAKQYMYYAPIIPNQVPLFDIYNPKHMAFLYSVMVECIVYGSELKPLSQVIFEAFDAVATKDQAEKYYERLQQYKEGNDPEFEREIVALTIIYTINWFHAQTYRFKKTGSYPLMGFYKYISHNSMLRGGMMRLALNFRGDSEPRLFRYYLIIAAFTSFKIPLNPIFINECVGLVDRFLDTFQFNLLLIDPNLKTGFRIILKAVEIIAMSLETGSQYSEWLAKNNTSKWWEGHMEF